MVKIFFINWSLLTTVIYSGWFYMLSCCPCISMVYEILMHHRPIKIWVSQTISYLFLTTKVPQCYKNALNYWEPLTVNSKTSPYRYIIYHPSKLWTESPLLFETILIMCPHIRLLFICVSDAYSRVLSLRFASHDQCVQKSEQRYALYTQ